MHVNTISWRVGRARLKVALVPSDIHDPAALSAYEDAARREACVLVAGFGAPFFYHQNGYTFAAPTLGGMRLRLLQLPTELPHGYTLHPATIDDFDTITKWYDALVAPLDIWAEPSETLLEGAYIIIDRNGLAGYVRLDYADPLAVYEMAAANGDGLSAGLAFARAEAAKTGVRRVALHLPPMHPALMLVGYLGAETLPNEAYQVKVLDERQFLLALGDELAARMAGGLLMEFDGRVVVDLYTHRIALMFSDGVLREVTPANQDDSWDVMMLPQVAAQLWLGWRSRAELAAWHPDVRVRRGMEIVIDTLFPKLNAYIYGPPHEEGISA